MKEIVFDIEANGLKPDKIWCIVAKPLGEPVVSFGPTRIKEGIEYLKNASNDNIGEASLLILILSSSKKFSDLDDFSIFAILEALNKIEPITMKKLIFEISVKNIEI